MDKKICTNLYKYCRNQPRYNYQRLKYTKILICYLRIAIDQIKKNVTSKY